MRATDGALALYLSYTIREDGKVTFKSKPRLCKSFLTAFIAWLFLKTVGPTTQSRTDTGGTSRALHRTSSIETDAASGNSTFGLVVGTGTTAVVITDSKLQTQITHGVGVGQLQYAASTVGQPSSTATTTSVILTRDFTNGSGATITIEEIGIYATMFYGTSGSSSAKFCLVRDLQSITLTNGALLTLNYELKTTS